MAHPGECSGSNASTCSCVTEARRFILEFITTGLSFASRNESDVNISFGRTNLYDDYVNVIEYLENNEFYDVCTERLRREVYQTEWCPSNPQLLAVASNQLKIYKYSNRKLRFLKNLLTEDDHNPVISIDWSCHDSHIIATRKDGSFRLLSLEYDSFSIGVKRELFTTTPFLSDPNCGGVRFGKGLIENSLIAIHKNKRMEIFDTNWIISHKLKCVYNILEVQCSKQGFYIALRYPRKISLYDVRSYCVPVNAYEDFLPGERAKCFGWSSHSPTIYIGTSRGGIIKWRTDQNIAEKFENSEKAPIQSIHPSNINPNLLFTTPIERGMHRATCIEACSI